MIWRARKHKKHSLFNCIYAWVKHSQKFATAKVFHRKLIALRDTRGERLYSLSAYLICRKVKGCGCTKLAATILQVMTNKVLYERCAHVHEKKAARSIRMAMWQ